MRRFLWTALAAGLAAMPIAAQNFGHFPSNTPTTGGGNSWPMNFSSTTGRFQQFLVPAASTDMPTGTPLKIVDVAWAPTSATTFTCSTDFQLRISNTGTTSSFIPSATFASNCPTCPTNGINRTSGFTWGGTANAWNDFGLDAHFGWDGSSIICIEVRYRGQNTAGGSSCRSDLIGRVWANSTSADNFVATTGSPSGSAGLKTRLTYVTDHICIAPLQAKLGATSPVNLHGLTPGGSYIVAASLGQTPFRLPTSPSCTIALDVDGLFKASQAVGPPLFTNYSGVVPPSGNVIATFTPPNVPALAGLCIYHAAVGINGSVVSCTNTSGTELIP